jgi:peroxiredoxin
MAHLLMGERLPQVSLASTSGEVVRLGRVSGRAVIVVYPYTGKPGVENPPDWDAIPGAHGSTPQLLSYQALYDAFAQAGVQVFGLSQVDADWQAEFAARNGLSFPLLSDAGFGFADALRLERFRTGGVDYLRRVTLLAEDGKIVSVHDPVEVPEADAKSALAWARLT